MASCETTATPMELLRDGHHSRVRYGWRSTRVSPAWSGVLAFPEVSPAGARDPVLFVAPAHTGTLPTAVERLEVWRLSAGGLDVREAVDRDVMAGVRWPP